MRNADQGSIPRVRRGGGVGLIPPGWLRREHRIHQRIRHGSGGAGAAAGGRGAHSLMMMRAIRAMATIVGMRRAPIRGAGIAAAAALMSGCVLLTGCATDKPPVCDSADAVHHSA